MTRRRLRHTPTGSTQWSTDASFSWVSPPPHEYMHTRLAPFTYTSRIAGIEYRKSRVSVIDVWQVCTSKFTCKKGKVFPYSLPSVWPGADPGVEAVSPQVTWSESRHRPGSRLPLLSAKPAVTSVAFTRWRYLKTAAHIWFQLATHVSTQKGWKAELA